MTLNYLKPFEPGEPIDINTLNKLIQNVNFLASQIAQIYRLPAVQAPVVTVTGATGATSGASGANTDATGTGNGNQAVSATEVIHLTIPRTIDFRKVGQTFTYTLSTATVEAETKKAVKSWKILTAGYSQLNFVVNKKPETQKTTCLGAKLTKVTTAGALISYVPQKDTDYKAGVNAPNTSGSAPWYRLYFNLDLTVEVTY